jgi:hypothetical protein
MEKLRQQAHGELVSIEADFAKLRDKVFKEKTAVLDKERDKIVSGNHSELIELLAENDHGKTEAIESLDSFYQLQLDYIQVVFQDAKERAHQLFLVRFSQEICFS